MRILYITPFLQHPSLHGPTRHFHFLRELSQRHAITLLTPLRSQITSEAMTEISTYTERVLTFDAIRTNPAVNHGRLRRMRQWIDNSQRRRRAIREMKQAFQQLLQQETFDLILFHGKTVFRVIDECHHPPVVADMCDATSMRIRGTMRYASVARLPWLLWQYLVIRRLEKKIIRRTPHLAFITPRDRDAVLRHKGSAKVLPNMVDLSFWKRRTNNPQPNCLMYSGGMNYRPNVDGALHLINDILPIVRKSIPNVKVLIVGRDPVPELIRSARHHPEVTITGAVEDMRPYFEQASVYACPLRIAAGQQNKLIEAMAMEVPVVTTSVAADGMRFEGGTDPPVAVADDKTSFADSIIRQLQSAVKRAQLAREGRRFIEDNFALSRSAETLEAMCKEAVGAA